MLIKRVFFHVDVQKSEGGNENEIRFHFFSSYVYARFCSPLKVDKIGL